MQPPLGWTLLMTEWLKMPSREHTALWRALSHSRYTRPVALRRQVGLIGAARLDLEYFFQEVLTPTVFIAVIEDLVGERRLARRLASRVEAYVFAAMDKEGRWY